MTENLAGFSRVVVARALDYAGLEQGAVKSGPHPDDGRDCLYLEATIQQYSSFLVGLTVQHEAVYKAARLSDRVQLQIDLTGDTRFWLPGVRIDGVWTPGTEHAAA